MSSSEDDFFETHQEALTSIAVHAASLAMLRIMDEETCDQHRGATESEIEVWNKCANGLISYYVGEYKQRMLLEGRWNDGDEQRLAFSIGYFFGRAFEELSVIQLRSRGEIEL